MAKFIPDAIIDAQLSAAEGTTIHVCSAQPANFAGISALELASDPVGTYTKANGDVSGRKNTQAGTTDTAIDTTGTATHIAVSNNTDTLFLVTTCTSQALTSGGTVSVGAFDHEIGDPT